jgi:lipoate-protein ligase A
MFHGEFKTPGGKLVVADFRTRDGQFADVSISGDFFLYPEDALTAINAAVEGAPVTATAEDLAARIVAALPPETEMFGFSPEAVGEALRRGLAS